MTTRYTYNDGGRSEVFNTNDCVTRALAIVTGLPYAEVFKGVKATGTMTYSGRVFTWGPAFREYAASLGLVYIEVNECYCKTTFPAKAVADIRGHYFAVIDGIINDTSNPTPAGRAIVRGYWMPKPIAASFNVYSATTNAKLNIAPLNYEQAETMARLMLLNYKKQTYIK